MPSSPKATPLCILTPVIGQASETFVRGHVEEVLPGGTSVICLRRQTASKRAWDASGPVLELEGDAPKWVRLWQRIYRLTLGKAAEAKKIARFLKEHQVEAVMVEYLDVTWRYLPALKAAGVRIYGRGLGYDVSSYLKDPKWVERYQALNGIDGIFVVTSHLKDRLVKVGIKDSIIETIPCGSHYKAEWSERTRGPEFRLVAVGRLVGKKAPHLTIEAVSMALKNCPNMRLDLVGDGALMAESVAAVERFGVGSKVTLHGAKPHTFVGELMAKADLFVQHSRVDPETGDEEGLPVAVLEAMSMGLPVVSTRHAGIMDAVVEGKTGILVDEGDLAGMAAAIERLYNSQQECLAMGRAGYERVQAGFSFEVERRRLLECMGLGR